MCYKADRDEKTIYKQMPDYLLKHIRMYNTPLEVDYAPAGFCEIEKSFKLCFHQKYKHFYSKTSYSGLRSTVSCLSGSTKLSS